jgi:gamma-glutamyltranspeptidase/glutathione hydrolase
LGDVDAAEPEGAELGVVAAGHPWSAQAGAAALRSGGNAVDAAIASMFAAFSCEPLLTGLGAGGYMLVVPASGEPVLLDFFVEAPGRRRSSDARPAALIPVSVSFGDAVQVFNIGCASVGVWGVPAGAAAASARFGRMALAELTGPAAALARDGVPLSPEQAYIVEILGDLVTSTPEAAALFAPCGTLLTAGEVVRQPELADALELLGSEGADPFYTGEVGAAILAWLQDRGGTVTREDLAAYRVVDREPVRVSYRGREILTNPPPSAGGILIARALTLLERGPKPASVAAIVSAMEQTQAARTPEFLEQLDQPGFGEAFLASGRLGSTTHVAVLDREGMACSVTCSNGASSGVIVPGTGVHLNNMLGEQDLNPLGFNRHPPGRRLPSMMAPTAVLRADGSPELVLGSAGSNRIRSAILQTILRVIDDGLEAGQAVAAPRLHLEDGVVYTEPGIDSSEIDETRYQHAPFRARNLFFGGVQAVEQDDHGRFWGGGDPRRGGAAVVVSGR